MIIQEEPHWIPCPRCGYEWSRLTPRNICNDCAWESKEERQKEERQKEERQKEERRLSKIIGGEKIC